ncbi:hypothetical protein SEL4614_12140 [Salmonella enterica subsp. enterica serovar 4,[5],12:i:-]|uniref:Lambda-like tail fibre protein N-terminal domain-containing protein n=1 Tax=Salmonella enterica subsp. enterica serovar 4,[5],12:i:- TaxID=440524 RepID=A0A8D5IWR3_SALET|nr:hypothetical protein SEL4614_12140 [Salmonella enterica subsp. enterica serovar 4,[5],12:i:-]
MNLKPACGRAFLWRQYASTYFRRTERWYGNAGTELHHSAEGLPDQYDVVVNTVASENPDDAGRYSMDVEQGQYTVTLLVDGYPPSHAGVITVTMIQTGHPE